MSNWMWRTLGQDFGPVELTELNELIARGTLGADDEVLCVGSDRWRRIATVPELRDLCAPQLVVLPPATGGRRPPKVQAATDKSTPHISKRTPTATNVLPPEAPPVRPLVTSPEVGLRETIPPPAISRPAVSVASYSRHTPSRDSNRAIFVFIGIVLTCIVAAVGGWRYLTRPQLIPLIYHKKPVVCVAFSPNGRWLATAGDDNSLCLWSASDGSLHRTLQGHTGHIMAVGFSRDSQRVITGAQDNTAKVWDIEKGVEVFTLQGHTNRVDGVAFSPDGSVIATGAWDKSVKIWDAWSGRLIREFPTHLVNCLCFSPDGQSIATCSWDWTIRVYDVSTGTQKRKFEGHSNGIHAVAFRPDGRQLVSASEDGTVRIWDVETGRQVLKLDSQAGPVYDAIFTPDSKAVISGGKDRAVKVWDPNTAIERKILSVHPIEVRGIACSPDGKNFASVGGKAAAYLWKRYLP